ncbi:Myb-like DNA-binding domain protein [Linnemannia exigua]|uniref:Myb-like DNA-binding domain protein n=1 Tax=Linnemannia exigua TaxID=604196 RepID=A0AAD4DL33_9FUNG|nr:Myb-like DNA-binding domain protein [Linnemannia exigua]
MSHKGKERQDSSNYNDDNSNDQHTQHLFDDLDTLSDGIDVDVDDLLSDESDNDDLIDNEADLALLLRTHGVTLDDPPALATGASQGTSSSRRAATVAAGGSTQGGSHGAIRVGGAGGAEGGEGADPTTTTGMDMRYEGEHQYHESAAQATSTRRSNYLHMHSGTNITLDTEMESDYGIDSSREHLHYDREDAVLEGSTSTTSDNAANADSVPASFVMDPEDNRRLTSVIRSQTANALEVNRRYQQALEQKLRDIENAHNRNRKLRDDLQIWLDRRELAERAPVTLPSTNDRLGPPYFVDDDEKTPPKNMDTKRKDNLPLIVGRKVRYWSGIERENLRRGVIAENKRLMFEKFLREGNTRAIDSLNNAPDVEMMLNTKGLDWKRISQRYVDNRSPSECLIQWTSHDHPGINKGDWSKSELMKLDGLVKKHDGRNWIQIALDLDTNRTGAQCFQKHQSKMIAIASKDNWTAEEDNILREAVRVLGEKNWQQVAYCLDNRNSVQCMTRWSKSVNPAIRRGRWLAEEDGALRAAYEVYGGGRWAKIQQHVLGRTDIQCRERYMNVLKPSLATGPWTKEEADRLDQLVEEHDREAIQKTMELKKKWENRIHKREMKIIRAKRYFDTRQDKRAQPFYKALLRKERYIYDCWNEQWGDHVDPIEKVFNLGIPPPISSTLDENAPAVGDGTSSIWNATLPEAASLSRPGKVRPVPPCNATLTAFSNLVQQGDFLGGRFQLPHTITAGRALAEPKEVLTAEEQQCPEYRELEERFEAVFMWPVLAGMLHMETARELVLREQAELAAKPKRRRGKGKKHKEAPEGGRRAGEDGDMQQGQEEASSSPFDTPTGSWPDQSETEDVRSSEYETDEDGNGGSLKRVRTDA